MGADSAPTTGNQFKQTNSSQQEYVPDCCLFRLPIVSLATSGAPAPIIAAMGLGP